MITKYTHSRTPHTRPCAYMHISTCAHIDIPTHICIYIHVLRHTCYTYTRAYAYTYTFSGIPVIHTHAHMHIHTRSQAYLLYIHTRICIYIHVLRHTCYTYTRASATHLNYTCAGARRVGSAICVSQLYLVVYLWCYYSIIISSLSPSTKYFSLINIIVECDWPSFS